MKGGTGLFIDNKNIEANFIEFLQNSDIKYLNRGTFGIVFKATIPPNSNYISKYKNIDYSGFGDPVKSLLIKFSVLGYNDNTTNKILSPIKVDDFNREVNIQTEVFQKTMKYLQPLCPAIVFSKTYGLNENDMIRIIVNKITVPESKSDLEVIINDITGYTLIGMELLDNYVTAFQLIKKVPTMEASVKNMAVYALIELCLKTGYSHADFHFSNIMINPNDKSYFQGVRGSVILIDFGMAVKIPTDILKQLKDLYNRKEYNEFIKTLCSVPRADNYDMNNSKSYSVICNYDVDRPTKLKLSKLFILKELATDDIVMKFNSKSDERDKYPLLPLTNSVKNQMFPGLIENTTSDDIEIVNLNVSKFKIDDLIMINDWIYDVVTHLLKNDIFIKIKNSNIIYCIINSCYISAWLIETDEFIKSNRRKYYQMTAILGMFFSGLNEDYSYSKNVDKLNIYAFYNKISDKAYTIDEIEEFCIKYKPIVENKRITTIYDFVKLNDLDLKNVKEFLTNPSILLSLYNDPKTIKNVISFINANTNRNKRNSTNRHREPKYNFPFKKQGYKFGGRTMKRKKNIKKTYKRMKIYNK